MLSVILYVTVFKRSGGDYPVYLQPFHTFAAAKETPELYREMLMNVFLFVPLGLTFPYIWPDRMKAGWKYALSVLAAILLSAAVEYLQYRYSLGVVETDDVIMNGLGAIIGGGEVFIRHTVRKA